MMNRHGFRHDAVNRVTFAKREIEVAFTVERDRPGPVQRRTFHRRTVRRRELLAGATIGLDPAAGKIYLSNTVVADIADEKPALGIHGNAMRLTKLGLCPRPGIPGESGNTGPRESGNDAR